MTKIQVQDLRPGDILLHAGIGEISKLIKWASDSIYSHAAMVYDATMLAEAMSKGVRFNVTLAERATDTADFSQIDVIRTEQAISPDNLVALQDSAQAMKTLPFALNKMVELGVICIVKNKITTDPQGRLLLWWLASQLLPSASDKLVCSEFVYRTYHGAATVPPGIVDPDILVLPGPKTAASFPKIDWAALWEEYEQARANGGDDPGDLPDEPDMTMTVTDDMLDEAMTLGVQQLRLTSAVGGLVEDGLDGSPVRIPDPAPATVLPQDLANSDTFRPLGRLL